MSERNVIELLSQCLRGAGATRAFRAAGHDLPAPPGLDVVDVGDPVLATLLADADGRLSRTPSARPGVALLPGRRIRMGSQPGAQVLAEPVLDVAELPYAVAEWGLRPVHGALELDIDLDPTAPVPSDAGPLAVTPAAEHVPRLGPDLAAFDTVILVGPGVVRDDAVPAVAEAARCTGARVVATPGAGAVLPSEHPSWRGVVGLQARDAVLADISGAELVVVAGIDPTEAIGLVPVGAQVLEVEPWQLALMAEHWPGLGVDAVPSDKGRELRRALGELAASTRRRQELPLHPMRAVADLADVLGPDDLLLADPGPVGLWLARGLLDRPAGTVVVPALPVHGFAAAGALVAGLDRRPALAVVSSPADLATEAILDLAASLGVPMVCEVWGAEVAWDEASEHRARLVGARVEGGVQRLAVPVDLAATRDLVEAAGPVTAWSAGGPVDG